MQFEAKIFGGLPVIVEVAVHGAQTDVGIMSPWFEVVDIMTSRTRKRDRRTILRTIPSAWWKRLEARKEIDQLEELAAGFW